jgi:hypothetical protein
MDRMSVKIYDRHGNINNFGTSKLSALSFTNANPTVLRTSVNHGLAINDVIWIRNFRNASTSPLQNLLHTTRWKVLAVVAADRVSVAYNSTGANLDLSAEAANQQITGTLPAYVLGANSEIIYGTGRRIRPTAYAAGVTGTNVTTIANHGLVAGDQISITGFDNGATLHDNQLINSSHIVQSAVAANIINISPTLSAYISPAQATSAQPAFTLGQNANILVEKYQVSFDFKFITERYYN